MMEPVLLMVTLYMSFVYGLVFVLIDTYPLAFTEDRQWSTDQGVIPLITIIVGVVFGCLLNFIWSYEQLMQPIELREDPRPEDQLLPMVLGAILLPIGLFIAAWTSFPRLSPVPQIMAGTPVGMGMSSLRASSEIALTIYVGLVLIFLKGNELLLQVYGITHHYAHDCGLAD
jgi:hypothetical protein